MNKKELREANRLRQANLAKRRKDADIFEIRGVWCHKSVHKAVKAGIRKWIRENT